MIEIAQRMETLACGEGFTETPVSGVRIYRTTASSPRSPLLYQQGIIIVGQGAKRVYIGEESYTYDPDHYLVLSVPLPAECEAMASEEEPFLGLMVDIDMGMLGGIIGEMEAAADYTDVRQGNSHHGLFLAKADLLFKDTVVRLLRALASPTESRVLGQALVRELIFRIMCGENATALHALAMKTTNLSRIDKALQQIHNGFETPMDVDQLAALVNMSTSAFHRAFKEVTSSSPIQYLKKVRLNKAKTLLAENGLRAGEAARMVGYESDSQFSREFKRYFGESPSQVAAARI